MSIEKRAAGKTRAFRSLIHQTQTVNHPLELNADDFNLTKTSKYRIIKRTPSHF